MYSKSSDSHSYLMPTAYHPMHNAHICKNIPKGVTKHIKRNYTRDAECELAFEEYKTYLCARDYSGEIIDEAICQAKEVHREVLLGTYLRT